MFYVFGESLSGSFQLKECLLEPFVCDPAAQLLDVKSWRGYRAAFRCSFSTCQETLEAVVLFNTPKTPSTCIDRFTRSSMPISVEIRSMAASFCRIYETFPCIRYLCSRALQAFHNPFAAASCVILSRERILSNVYLQVT